MKTRYVKVNGNRIPVIADQNGVEWVEQYDARAGMNVIVSVRGARAMRSEVAHYPLCSNAEEILQKQFYDQNKPHALLSEEEKKANVRKLLRAVVSSILDIPEKQ